MNVKKYLFEIDLQISKNKNLANVNIYNLVIAYNEEILKLFRLLQSKEENLFKFVKREVLFLKTFNLTFNDLIKNEKDYIFLNIALIVIKTFMSTENSTLNKNKNSEDSSLSFSFLNESNDLINNMMRDYSMFLI